MVKRFYKNAAVVAAEDGFVVQLDGKSMKTPRQTVLRLPSRALAEAVAEEWAQQSDEIDPLTMPMTRLSYTAVDGAANHAQIADQALGYAKTDLLCYRADHPAELVARQAASWDPLLDWLAEAHAARLVATTGVRYVEQPAAALSHLTEAVTGRDSFALVGLHAATAITGSLVLALALAEGRLPADDAFARARVDELFQAEKWGLDAEAEARARILQAELTAVERFIRLAGQE